MRNLKNRIELFGNSHFRGVCFVVQVARSSCILNTLRSFVLYTPCIRSLVDSFRRVLIPVILAIFMTIILGLNCFADEVLTDDFAGQGLKIQYLPHTHVNISSHGINRLHFNKARILKIVGDTSSYEALLADNGSNLFLTSKVPSPEIINLTLLLVSNKAIDLKLHVVDSSDPCIINIDESDEAGSRKDQKLEIKEMMNAMVSKAKGKYFIEEKKRVAQLPNHPEWFLNQYVSYRYGNLAGAGFTYSLKSRKAANQNIIEPLTPEMFKGVFQNILAIGISGDDSKKGNNEQGDSGRVFVVFAYGEGIDV